MEHTRFTTRNYGGFATVMLLLGLITTGAGAVDLAMVAPKGIDHVAAVGQGDLLVLGIFAFFLGIVDAFGSRLAIAEGERTTARRLPVLAAALLLLLVACQLIGLVVAAGIEPVLTALGQNKDLIPLVSDYVEVRMYGIGPMILFWGLNETLKICGAKSLSVGVLALGFVTNATTNWAFLYSGLAGYFTSPESAVAAGTVISQVVQASCAGWLLGPRLRARGERFLMPDRSTVKQEFWSMTRTGSGVGTRHINDYVGAIVPVMFISTIGTGVLAAALVATKIYTVFCRVPQACFQATFVFYGYAVGQGQADLARTVRRLLVHAAAPTAVATLVVVLSSPWLVSVFASEGLDQSLTRVLLLAYILYVPAYFFEQSIARILTVHQRGDILFMSSTLLTYVLSIPLAWYSVFVLDSTFLAIASNGLGIAIQAGILGYLLRRQLHAGIEASHA